MPELDSKMKENIEKLTDEDLLRMLDGNPNDYLTEVWQYALDELNKRGDKETLRAKTKENREQIEKAEQEAYIKKLSPDKIGGWLILPAIGLIIGPLVYLYSIIIFLNSQNAARLEGYFAFHIIMNILLFIFTIYAAVLFFKKNKLAPRFIILLLLAGLAYNIIDVIIASNIGFNYGYQKVIQNDLLRQIIGCAIWIPYFIKSQRVKLTFVKG